MTTTTTTLNTKLTVGMSMLADARIGEFDNVKTTVTKLLSNIQANPAEAKYRKIRHGNPNFAAKVYGHKGAPGLLELAGFKKDTIEDGFLVLPESADLALVQRAMPSCTTMPTTVTALGRAFAALLLHVGLPAAACAVSR